MASPSISDLLKEARSRLQALDAQMAEARKKEDLGTRLERLERSLAEVGTRVTTLATQVEGLGKAAEALRKSGEIPADLRARLDRYENAIADLSRKIGGEKDTFVAYRQSVRQLVQATAHIKPGDVESLRQVVEQHLSQYPEREARVKSLEARLESVQTLQARLQDMEAAARKSAEGFDERLKAVGKVGEELERMKAGVVKEVGSSGAKVERLREQAERLDAQVREVPALVKREVDAALVGALGELWTKTKALDGEVAKAREEAGKPGQNLLILEKEVWAMQAKVRGAEEGIQAVRGDLSRGREDVIELKGELKALRDLPGRLKEFEAVRGDLARAREEAADLRANLRALQEIPGRLDEVDAVLADLARVKEESADLKAELRALQEIPGRLEEAEAALADLARARGETAELREEMKALQGLPGRLGDVEAIRADLARAREETADLKIDMKALRDLPTRVKEFEVIEASLANTRNEAENMRNDLKALRDLHGRLKGLETRTQGLQALQADLVTLRADLAKTKEETTDMKDGLKVLRDLPAWAKELKTVEADLAKTRDEAKDVKYELKTLWDLPARIKEVSARFPELEAKLRQVDAGLQAQRETAEQVRRGEARLEALERSVAGLVQRSPAGPGAEELRRQRQSILALLETLKSGYEQKLLGKEEYEAIARENREKIAELDSRIAEMGRA